MRRTAGSVRGGPGGSSSFGDLTALLSSPTAADRRAGGRRQFGSDEDDECGEGGGATGVGEQPGPSIRKVIIVANTLPVRWDADADGGEGRFELDDDALLLQARPPRGGEDGAGATAAAATTTTTTTETVYVGQLPGAHAAGLDEFAQEALSVALRRRLGCLPVFLGARTGELYYKGFCKRVLWPVMHYSLPLRRQQAAGGEPVDDECGGTGRQDGDRFDPDAWHAYLSANKSFADVIMEVISPENEDLVWINDYHLMALPSLMRKRLYTLRCGFFLHCPFPSSEVFRALPQREELLRSLLSADLIGFHTFDYARHFLSCCTRLLGLEYQTSQGSIAVQYYGRKVSVRISPTGVDVGRLRSGFCWPDCEWRRGELAAQFAGKIVIAGVDDMDTFKGIELKLEALRTLLGRHPGLARQLVMVQVAHPARSAAQDVQDLAAYVHGLAAEINGAHGRPGEEGPLIVWERPVPLYERIALYSVADVAVVTATRDGMNLVPYEYIACREGPTPDAALKAQSAAAPGPQGAGSRATAAASAGGDGEEGEGEARGGAPREKQQRPAPTPRNSMLVVSEFVGCSPSLSGAVRVNPWNIESLADNIYHAITLPLAERESRHRRHWRYIERHTVQYWSKCFLNDLERACANHGMMRCYGLGFGLSFRVVAMDPNFRKLELPTLLAAYSQANRRVLLLDYDGTLVPAGSLGIGPSPEVIATLGELCRDTRNSVYIVSGRCRTQLDAWFGAVPRLGIAAEHGFAIKHFDAGAGGAYLYRRVSDAPAGPAAPAAPGPVAAAAAEAAAAEAPLHSGWIETVLPILELYTDATDGSYIERKESSLVWNYRDADPDFGLWQAKDLTDHLESVLSNEPLEVARGQCIVEVKPQGVSKGATAEAIITHLGNDIDFVFCVGDDRSDEDMFACVEDLTFSPHMPAEVIACTVGQKPSRAKYYLNDANDVMDMVRAIAKSGGHRHGGGGGGGAAAADMGREMDD